MGVENYRPGHSASSAWDSDPSAPSPMLARAEAISIDQVAVAGEKPARKNPARKPGKSRVFSNVSECSGIKLKFGCRLYKM
jgi:hypothetical protein